MEEAPCSTQVRGSCAHLFCEQDFSTAFEPHLDRSLDAFSIQQVKDDDVTLNSLMKLKHKARLNHSNVGKSSSISIGTPQKGSLPLLIYLLAQRDKL